MKKPVPIRYVLDASAVIALLLSEPGSELVFEAIKDGVMSAVNLTEALSKLRQRGMAISAASQILRSFQLQIEPFDEKMAHMAAALQGPTKQFGLSMGDRACLAVAQHLAYPVITADKIWSKLDLGLEIKVIR